MYVGLTRLSLYAILSVFAIGCNVDNGLRGSLGEDSSSSQKSVIKVETSGDGTGSSIDGNIILEAQESLTMYSVERKEESNEFVKNVEVAWVLNGSAANLLIKDNGKNAELVPTTNGTVEVKAVSQLNTVVLGIEIKPDQPDAFSFADVNNQATSSLINSEIIQITGLATPVDIAISGAGSPEYRVCTDGSSSANCDGSVVQTWTSIAGVGVVQNNHWVQIRLNTSAAGATTRNATLTISDTDGSWDVTTIADPVPDAFNLTDLTGQPLSTLISSNRVQITGLDTGTNISISGDGSPEYRVCTDGSSDANCDGSEVQTWTSTSGTGTVLNNYYVQVRLTSNAAYTTMNSATLDIGGVTDQWDVTTINDTTPNAFSFTDTTNEPLSTLIASNIVQITGINAATNIAISGEASGQYRVCTDGTNNSTCTTSTTQNWTSTDFPVIINNNEYLQLRLTTSATHTTMLSINIDVGGVTDQWDVTTLNDTTPDAFSFTDQNDVAESTTIFSNILQITGIDTNVDISISGGGTPEYRVCTDGSSSANCDGSEIQTWTATTGMALVQNNHYVQLRTLTFATPSTLHNIFVDVGASSDIWSVTTADNTTPNAFSFADQTNRALSSLIESNIIQITGINVGASVSISGDGSPQYRTCIDGSSAANCDGSILQGWTSTPGTIGPNHYIQIRLTSNAANSTMNSATLNIGGVTDQWDVTTIDDATPDAFSFTDTINNYLSTSVASNIIQITGLVAGADISISGDGSPQYRVCTDGTSTFTCDSSEVQTWTSTSDMGTVLNNYYVQVRLTSNAAYSTMNSATLNIGGVTDQWDVTTEADIYPDAFDFTTQTNLDLSTVYHSNIEQITGIATAVDISVLGVGSPEYRICTDGSSEANCDGSEIQTWTSSAGTGTVLNNYYVQIRETTSALYNNGRNVTLNIGGGNDTWLLVTKQDDVPDAFSFTDAADEPLTTLTPSDIIQISGLVTGADISISGDGTPQYRVCTDGSSSTNCDGSEVQTWTATTGIALVQNNHYVQVRLTSNAANSTMNSATLNIGGVTDQWDVTTINDINPNAFNFTDQSGVTASTLIVSDIVQIFGIDTGVDISVFGDGSPEYRICSDGSSPANCDGSETQTWTSLPLIGAVNNNEYVQLRLTANASAGATNNATLTVGGTNDTWAVTTYTPNDNTPDAFDFIDMNDIALSTQTASDIVQITGIDVAVDLSISGGGSPEFRVCTDGSSEANCDGSETQTWTAGPVVGAVVNNDYVQVRLTSSVSNSTTLQTTLNVGTESANWDVTTENDTYPMAFGFADISSGAPLSTLLESDIVQITGIDAGTNISISGDGSPEYRICTDGSSDANCDGSEVQTWTSISGTATVFNNYWVQVRLTSSASYSTTSNATLDVGGVTDQWTVGTLNDIVPDAFSFTDTIDEPLSTLVSSNIVQISGINFGTDISISGDGSPQYRVCTNGSSEANCDGSELITWTSTLTPFGVNNGDYVQIRLTSNAANSTMNSATLDIGGVTDQWDVTSEYDSTPNAFSFSDETNVALSTLITSDIVQITGIDNLVDISISGSGAPEYRVCDSSDCSSVTQNWRVSYGTGLVFNNYYVQIRLNSSASNSTTLQAALTVGETTSTNWSVTTVSDTTPNAFDFTNQNSVALSSLIESDILQITGIDTGVDISVSGDGSPEYRVCTDGSSDANCDSSETQTWTSLPLVGLVNNNEWVQVRLTSSGSSGTGSNATLTIGSTNDTWTVTTFTPNDNTPDAFDFTDANGITLSTLTASDIVQITGIDVAVDLSISGSGSPEFRVCTDGSSEANCDGSETQTWTAGPVVGAVTNNDYVQIRLTSSSANTTTLQTTLNVGTGSANWDVTTENDTTPNGFSFTNQVDVALSTLATSNIVQITGIDTATDISILGSGSAQYRVCDNSDCSSEVQTWGTSAGTSIVLNNYYVQIRLTSSASNSTTRNATLTVGGTSSPLWQVTTIGDTTPDAFSFTDQAAVEPSTLIESNILQITGINTDTDISVSGSGSPQYRVCTDGSSEANCDGSEIQTWTAVAGTGIVQNNYYVQVRLTSHGAELGSRLATLDIGGVTDDFNVTSADFTPLAFNFTNQTDVAQSTVISSNIVQITGINSSVNVSVAGAGSPQYRVCDNSDCSSVVQSWQSGASTDLVENNYYVQIRLTSSALNSTSHNAALTVGSTSSGMWQVTTEGDTTPDAFSFTNQSDVTFSTVITSNVVQITGIDTLSDISVSGGGSPEYRVCNNSDCSSEIQTWQSGASLGLVNNNDYVQARLTSGNNDYFLTNVNLVVGGTPSANWEVTTGDGSTNPISFTNQNDVALNTVIESDIVQVTGITIPVNISISGGGSPEYRVCSNNDCSSEIQTWGSTAGTAIVDNNDYVQIRLTSLGGEMSPVNATLQVGATSATPWMVVTGDNSPSSFNFIDQDDVALNSVIESDIVQITGISIAVDISVTGSGSPEYRVCDSSDCSSVVQTWGTSAGLALVNNNDYVQVRTTSGNSDYFANSVTLTVGSTSSLNWHVTTGDSTPSSFNFVNQNDVPLNTVTESNIVQITSISMPVNISVSGFGSPEYRVCSNNDCSTEVQTWSSTAGTALVDNNDYVQIRLTSQSSEYTFSSATLTVGSTSSFPWNVTTGDGTPSSFNFTNQTNKPLNTLIESNIVQITSISFPVDISVSGDGSPEYRVCSNFDCSTEVQTWGATAGTSLVNDNDYVQVRLTSQNSQYSLSSATLVVGSTSSFPWNVTTGDDTPNPYNFAPQSGVALSTVTSSSIVQISGISMAVDISVSGDGSPEYRVCNNFDCSSEVQTWSSSAGNSLVADNNYVQVRLTSSALSNTMSTATLDISGVTTDFNITTLTPDTTPDSIDFVSLTSANLSTQYSAGVQISGINTGTNISVAGDGSPEYRVCSDFGCSGIIQDWTTAPGAGIVQNSYWVWLRNTSSASYSTTVGATVTVGTVTSSSFDITTIDDTVPDAFNFTNATDVSTLALIESDIMQISGISTAVDISISGDGSPEFRVCTDGSNATNCGLTATQSWTSTSQTSFVSNGDYVQIRLTSAPSYSTLSQTTLTVGGASDTWDVTTTADNIPDAFSFSDVTDIALSTLTPSDIVQITGLATGVDISVSGDGTPEYRICTNGSSSANCDGSEVQTWTSTAGTGTVLNNYYVQVRLTSNAANSTMNSTTLDVGGITDQWDVTTIAADTTPDAFSFTDQTDVAASSLTPSDIVQITGIDTGVDISVTGDGTPQYRVCTDGTSSANCDGSEVQTWTTSAGTGTVLNNYYVQVRLTSSASYSTGHSATLDVSGVTDIFTATTGVNPALDVTPFNFDFTDLNNQATGTQLTSDIVQILGYGPTLDVKLSGYGSTPYDISKINYNEADVYNYLSFRFRDAQPRGVAFNSTGTELYMVGQLWTDAYQYSLSTPYDITTATYTGKKNTTPQVSDVRDIAISNDGSMMYILDGTADSIYEYNLTTPYDITTATYTSTSFSVAAQDDDPYAIDFNSTGTILMVLGQQNDSIYRYNLSPGYDLSSASYASSSFSVAAQDTQPVAMAFSTDGTQLFVGGDQTYERVYKYTLSTGWDLASASHNGTPPLWVYGKVGTFNSLEISSDGSKLFVLDQGQMALIPFELSTPYDVLTAKTSIESFDMRNYNYQPFSFEFSSNGQKMYVSVYSGDFIFEFDLDIPFVAKSAIYNGKYYDFSAMSIDADDIAFNNDGSTLFILSNSTDRIYQFTLGTNWGISTASYANKWGDVGLDDAYVATMHFNHDGSKVFVTGGNNTTLDAYTLSTPFDASTIANSAEQLDMSGQLGDARAFDFNMDGTKVYVADNTNDQIALYNLASPYNLTGAVYSGTFVSLPQGMTGVMTMQFNADGTLLQLHGFDHVIYEYNLSTPYDVTEIPSNVKNQYDFSAQTATAGTVNFSQDGTRMQVSGFSDGIIYEYTLSTPFDVNTASYTTQLNVSAQATYIRAIRFGDDGNKMYVIDYSNHDIFQYNTATPYRAQGATYASKTLYTFSPVQWPKDILFVNGGTEMYLLGNQSSRVYHYNLSTAWDISTAVYSSNNWNFSGIGTAFESFDFSKDGTKLFILDDSALFQFDLSTPFDISTRSTTSVDIGLKNYANMIAARFSSDGSRLFTMSSSTKTVYQFDLGGSISPEFRTCSDGGCSDVINSWASSGTIDSGDYIQLRAFSSTAGLSTVTTNVDIGNAFADWKITTIPSATPSPLVFTDQTDVNVSTVYTSNIIPVVGIDQAVNISVAGAGSPEYRVCLDGACSTEIQTWGSSLGAGIVEDQYYVQMRLTSDSGYEITRQATLTVGNTTSANWSVTTMPVPDTMPNTLGFVDLFDMSTSTQYESNIAQVTGLDSVSVTVSISGLGSPEFRICSNSDCSIVVYTWGSSNLSLENNQYLQLRLTSSASDGTRHYAQVDIGMGREVWNVTTASGVPGSQNYTAATSTNFVVPAGIYNLQVAAYGAGGGGGGDGTGNIAGSDGGDTTVDGTIVAGGGSGGLGGGASGTGGSAGVASGGDINTNGSNGQTSPLAGTSGAGGNAGNTSGNGGTGGAGVSGANGPGIAGNTYGGGGSGARQGGTNYGGGGGGGGAYVYKYLSVTPSQSIPIVVGLGGTGGPGVQAGGAGADGAVFLNWVLSDDITPDSFSFTNQTGVGTSTLTTSNIVQINGVDTSKAYVSVNGDGSPEYRTCSTSDCSSEIQTWTNTSVTIDSGEYLQIRMTSSASSGAYSFANVSVGVSNVEWSLYTGDATPGVFDFTDLTDVAASTLFTSTIHQVTGIQTNNSVVVSLVGDGGAQFRICDTSDCSQVVRDWSVGPNVIDNNQYIQLSMTSGAANGIYHTANLSLGTLDVDWVVATVDDVPNSFAFTDQTDVAVSTVINSDIIQVGGLTSSADISISGDGSPEYRVCSNSDCSSEVQTWGTSAGTDVVQNNYYVQMRLTSNATNSTMNSATLNVGGITDQWDVTTIAAPSGFKTWRKISAGFAHTCGLSADGNIFCWGTDGDGELGDDTSKVAMSTPVPIDRTNIPAGVYFTDVEAGDSFTIALASNGKAYGWGKDNRGQIGTNNGTGDKTIPEELSFANLNTAESLISVAAGAEHACGLSSDGLAYCWGRDLNGQNGDNASFVQTNLPTLVDTSVLNANEKYVQIDVGATHSCATTTEQRVFCWGSDASGQLGENTDADNNDEPLPTLIDISNFNANEYITQLTLGHDFSCGLTNQANVYCWGSDSHGQLGEGTASDTSSNVPVAIDPTNLNTGETFVKLAAGYHHICGITNQGRNGCWGYNSDGQLGEGDLVNFKVSIPTFDLDFTKLSSGETFVSLSLGKYHTCGVTSLGKGYCWGDDDGSSGSLGDDSSLVDMDEPTPVDDSALSSGVYWASAPDPGNHTCGILSDGTAYCWGNDASGQLGENADSDNANEVTPSAVDLTNLTSGTQFVSIVNGEYHSCGITNNGRTFCWGYDGDSQLGENDDADNNNEIIPVEIDYANLNTGERFIQLAAGTYTTCGVTNENRAFCWGDDYWGQLGNNASETHSDIPELVSDTNLSSGEKWTKVAVGVSHSCGITRKGNVFCWGLDMFGQLGENADADNNNEFIPVAIDDTNLVAGEKFTDISAGDNITCVVSNLGNAYCWGYNSDGEIGDNSTSSSNIPVAVNSSNLSTGASFVSITNGGKHTCALASDGKAYCWGLDSYGQVGESTNSNDKLLPVAVDTSALGSGVNFIDIKAGRNTTCGLSTDGKAYCWGEDQFGQLGEDTLDGDNNDEIIPVQVDDP